jgi:fatty acid desaturase
MPNYFTWIAAVAYWAIWFFSAGPYILMLHATVHKNVFSKKYDFLNFYIRNVLSAYYGLTYQSYFAHHLVMHHFENNGRKDKSTTIIYQRDSFRHWLHYLFNFHILGYYHLLKYFIVNKKYSLARKIFANEFVLFLIIIALGFFNLRATLILFIIPLLVTRVALMMGNWGQHAFVDLDDSENPYKYAVTLINTPFNDSCFNDGYHVVHHIQPGLNWTDMPAVFEKNIPTYNEHLAIVFSGLKGGFAEVWLNLMLKRYDYLADKMAPIGLGTLSHEQRIAIMKKRLLPQIAN